MILTHPHVLSMSVITGFHAAGRVEAQCKSDPLDFAKNVKLAVQLMKLASLCVVREFWVGG